MSANKRGDIVEMDERKIKILQAIISDYIETAEPVGSRTIAKKYDLGISSATIRNEMSDLEEMGYLEQLHTSSGRKPSDKGYRLYVDKLMKIQKLSDEEELIIKNKIINAALFEVDKIVKQATSLLSELTKFTSIVQTPSARGSYIKSVQLLGIDDTNILCVIITDNGIIKNNLIRVVKNIDVDTLLKLNIILNRKLRGLTTEEINLRVINELKEEMAGYEDIFNAIIPQLYDSLTSTDMDEIYTEGTTNIFNYPEYKDIDRARDFLSLLDDKENVKSLLNPKKEVSISIGEENFLKMAKDCSVISAVYSIGGKPLGSIGIIGPTRMPYSKVISIITFVVKEINNSLNKDDNEYR